MKSSKRNLLALFAFLGLVSCEKASIDVLPQPAVQARVTSKKGVGLNETSFGNSQLSALHVSWYYSWGFTTSLINPPAQFIPMAFSLNTLPRVTTQPIILGFNEPDNASQSNITVANALSNWSTLVSRSTRLGSPGTAGNPLTTGSWLTQFMTSSPTPKVDFVCVHWYKGVDYAKFKSDITAIINLYRKPVWITEFAPQTISSALASPTKYTQTQINTFLSQVIPWMEANPMVEKYAYHDCKYGNAAIFTSTGALTPTGVTYRDLY